MSAGGNGTVDEVVALVADSLSEWNVISGINFQNYESEMALQVVRTLERAGILTVSGHSGRFRCSAGHVALHDDGRCHAAVLGEECGLQLFPMSDGEPILDRARAAAVDDATARDCCLNADWRYRPCEYHQGFEDGYDAALVQEALGDRAMSEAPTECLYCDGTDPNCGFCEMGKPLDSQEDWDRSWGRIVSDD